MNSKTSNKSKKEETPAVKVIAKTSLKDFEHNPFLHLSLAPPEEAIKKLMEAEKLSIDEAYVRTMIHYTGMISETMISVLNRNSDMHVSLVALLEN